MPKSVQNGGLSLAKIVKSQEKFGMHGCV